MLKVVSFWGIYFRREVGKAEEKRTKDYVDREEGEKKYR